jgi:predicted metal-binding transcription factor (methanogenesis marker protein 9)
MWNKIKDWFVRTLDLDRDGKVTAEDIELAKALAEKELKKANDEINKAAVVINDQITDAVTQVKKATKGRKKK